MQQELFCRLVTRRAEHALPEEQIALPLGEDQHALSQFVNSLLQESSPGHSPQPFAFLLAGQLLQGPLGQHLAGLGLSTEQAHVIEYFVARVEPASSQQHQEDDWVCRVHAQDEHAVAVLFNGSIVLHSADLARVSACRAGPCCAADCLSFDRELWVALGGEEAVSCLKLEREAFCSPQRLEHPLPCPAYAVALDQLDPSILAAGLANGLLQLYKAGEGLAETRSFGECRDRVGCVRLVGHRLLAGSFDHQFRAWDIEQGCLLRTVACKDSVVTALDEKHGLTLTSHEDAYVKLWDERQAIPAKVFKAHSKLVSAVQWHPAREQEFLTASYDSTVRLWDCRSEKRQVSLEQHADKVFDASWAGAEAVLSGGADSRLVLQRW